MMHLDQVRNVIKRSRELLANTPLPDTFAGRKTGEPFPSGEDPRERDDIQILIQNELEPPKSGS
ncbi:hypothetical protein [Bradyrhizobium sp.]|uniref:hypothetical protein n=1 Tax=Bradyrhizobium sp. TaxID=376 RepID=UPI00260C5A46|nr:hypothetical protein [Bradyrhizobium sp.]